MKDFIKITWQVDDGYSGNSRPQYTYVNIDDYNDCESEKDKQNLIEDAVYEDMQQMSFYISNIEMP